MTDSTVRPDMAAKRHAVAPVLDDLSQGQEEMLLFLADRLAAPPPGDVVRLISALQRRGLVRRVLEDHGRYRPTDLGQQTIDYLTDLYG